MSRSGDTTRTAILDAAERIFAAKGYRASSLELIGRAAGLSRGAPGYFFGSKERLYCAVLARVADRARIALAPVYSAALTSPGLPEEYLLAFVEHT